MLTTSLRTTNLQSSSQHNYIQIFHSTQIIKGISISSHSIICHPYGGVTINNDWPKIGNDHETAVTKNSVVFGIVHVTSFFFP